MTNGLKRRMMFRIEGNDANIEEYWSEREKIQIAQMKIKMLSYLKPARYLVIYDHIYRRNRRSGGKNFGYGCIQFMLINSRNMDISDQIKK